MGLGDGRMKILVCDCSWVSSDAMHALYFPSSADADVGLHFKILLHTDDVFIPMMLFCVSLTTGLMQAALTWVSVELP